MKLTETEAILASYALEELLNSDGNLPFEQIRKLLTRFENKANELKQNKFTG